MMSRISKRKMGLLFTAAWLWFALAAGAVWAADSETGDELQAQDKAIFVAGRYLPLDEAPFDDNGSILVPLRAVSTALGAEVLWQNGQALISQGGHTLALRPGSLQAQVDGESVQMAAAPQLRNGRVFVPLRFIGEQLGAEVGYFDFIIDIEPAAGAEIPLWSGGLPNGPEANCTEDRDYIYLAAWDKAGQNYQIKRIDKQTLAETVLLQAADCSCLQALAGGLYFSDNGKLTKYDLQTGKVQQIQDRVWRFSVYDGWLYYFNSADKYGSELVLQRRPWAGGEAEARQVAQGPLLNYWFAGESLYYNHYNIKSFRADLDGQNAAKLAQAAYRYDAGWYYYIDQEAGQIWRSRAEGSGADKQLFGQLRLEEGWQIDDFKVLGGKVFYTVDTRVQVDGRSDWLSGPLFYADLPAGNIWQLTEGRCGEFYVLRDHCVYHDLDNNQWKIVKWSK